MPRRAGGEFHGDYSPPPQIDGRPAGDYTLPGRADLADLALDPANADLAVVVASTKKAIRSMPRGQATPYRESVEATFFGTES